MLTHSNNQSHPLRKIIKALLISFAILLMAGLAQHLWGRWKLASVKREMAARGQMVDLRMLPTNSVPGHTEFSNKLHQIGVAVGSPSLSGGGNLVLLSSGMAARGSQAPAPIAYDATVVFTNGYAVLHSPNAHSWSEIEKRYVKHAPNIAELRKLLQNPPRTIPGHYLDTLSGNLPNFISMRQCAQLLNDAIVLELHHGNLSAAEENLIALAGFTRLYAEDPTLVPQMIRVAIQGIGTAALWDAVHANGWSEPQLRRLQEAWTSPPTVTAVVRSVHMERLSRIELYEQMRTRSYKEWAETHRQRWLGSGAAQPYPQSLETLRDLFFHPAWRVFWAHQEAAEFLEWSDFQTTTSETCLREKNFGDCAARWSKARPTETVVAPICFYLEIPYWDTWISLSDATPSLLTCLRQSLARQDFEIIDFSQALKVAAENDVRREMAVTALAVKRFALKNGKIPEKLDALVPEFLSELPVDWMAGQPLKYRTNSDQSYTLYSVGADGRDDGADPTPIAEGQWETRDIVWLTPVPWQP